MISDEEHGEENTRRHHLPSASIAELAECIVRRRQFSETDLVYEALGR